jgi:outer membrane receptor protein involved in Fe transport
MSLFAKRFMMFVVLFICIGCIFNSHLNLNAQTSNGTIAGTITDKSGGAVANATVQAFSQSMGKTLGTATTDSSGGYRIDALFPGKYSVTVKSAGFSELRVSDVDVRGSYTTTVSGVLELGALSSTITVEASVGQELQTQSGELSKSFGEPEIANLPYQSLNPISLVLTQAGVSAGDQVAGGITNNSNFSFRSNGQQFTVNGRSPRSNNFLIDGQDNNDNSIAGQAFQPINEAAVGEVTILTNSYSAEFGRGGGSVTNVISKGGTNDFHGSAWELNRNSYYAAIPADQGFNGSVCSNPPPAGRKCGSIGNPVDNENTFGYAVGGPVLKNKLFFFQSTQWDRERQTANGSPLNIPTANGIATLQSLGPNANVDFLVAALAGLRGVCPQPCSSFIALGNDPVTGNPRPAVEMGFVERSGISARFNGRQENARADWIAGEKDSFSARYIRGDAALSPDLFNFPNQLQPFDSQQGGPSQTIGTTWVHTFSAKAVNEFRVSFTEINFSFSATPATAANPLSSHAAISITTFPTLGFPSNLPQGRGHKTWQYQDGFSYNLGKHTFKAGADVTHLAVVDQIPFNSRGTITYVPGCGGTACTSQPTSLANFVDDFAGPGGAASKVFGSPVTKPFVSTYSPYVQDTYRLTSNFTLNLGLRYEYWGTPENTLLFPAVNTAAGIGLPGQSFPNMYAQPQQGDFNTFAPRVGLAYTPRFWNRLFGQGKTVIRAGYGIFYDGIFTNILDNTAGASPNAIGFTATSNVGRGVANASAALAAAQAVLNPTATVTTIASNLRNPLTHQWNLNVQRELPGGFIFSGAYVGTRGERLFVTQAFNPRVNGGARINPNFGAVNVRDNAGDSIYHGGQFQLDRKFSHGLLLRFAYTYSKLLDDGSDVFGPTGGFTINRNDFSQNPLCQKCDRGPSIFDVRHRFVASYVWDLPYVHNSSNLAAGIVKALTRDWTISGTTTAQTGFPGTVFLGIDTLGDGSTFNDRPIVVDPTKGVLDPARYGTQGNPKATPPIPPTYKANTGSSALVGTIGRGSIPLPGFSDWDFAVTRAIRLPMRHFEGQKLSFRGEAFNVFNHPNLGIPNLNWSASDFGNLAETIYGGRILKIKLTYSF